jgi:hypothetical protein
MQALRRFPLESKVGLILHESNEAGAALDDDSNTVAVLEKENARLRRTVEELESAKKSLLERTLRLERLLAEQQQQYNNRQRGIQEPTSTIMLPPHLFMKAYALMRGSTKPLVLRVTAKEAVDIDKMKI